MKVQEEFFNGTDSTGDRAQSIAVSPGGNQYYAGSTTSNGYKLRICKTSFYGGDWVRTYDVYTYQEPTPKIVITDDEDVYVITHIRSYKEKNAYVIKLNYLGVKEWTRTFNGFDNLEDYPLDLALDNNNNLLVLCYSEEANNQASMVLIKYNPEGDTLWINRYQSHNIEPKALAIDSDNNIYALSRKFIVKYDSEGNEEWVEDYLGSYAIDIAVDKRKNIYVTGFDSFSGTGFDILTVKYSHVTDVKEPLSSNIPKGFSLSQNYPNPFNPSTWIKYEIPDYGGHKVELKVYDVMGKEIATLVDNQQSPGTYEVEWNADNYPSGIYFYRLSTGTYTDAKKMLLLK